MKGKWEDVIEMYKEDERLHKARITRAGDTALHIAVSEGKEVQVKQMVDIIMQKEHKEALKTQNNRENTALHLAASMGNPTMCHIIASVEPSLVDDRNVDGETPLFLAAVHGRKQAFLFLHYIQNPNNNEPNYVNCRRNNGDTFLHCAINGEYFDLAFQIIHLYKEPANQVNEEGLSPLHLLASKPCAFRSGSRLGRTETIIYNCIYVEELKVANPPDEQQTYLIAAKDNDTLEPPENYNTLCDAFRILRKAISVVTRKLVEPDEDPEAGRSQVQGNPLFPSNYRTCCNSIKFFYVVLLIILGQGSEDLKKIYRKKEKHIWSVQIVKVLLRHASSYQHEDDGSNPNIDEGNNTIMTQGVTLATSFEPSSIKNMEDGKQYKRRIKETPILVVAKNGVMEIIEKIVELFPVAIHDLTEDKNIVLLAVQHRQPHVYKFLLSKNIYKESLFHQVDMEENTALHLAATFGDYKPWLIPGEALQMQWELKWFKFVNESMPPDFFGRHNMKYGTPEDVFTKTHKDLVQDAAEWLYI